MLTSRLPDSTAELIHEKSLEILGEVGFCVPELGVLSRLEAAGFPVERDSQMARVTQDLLLALPESKETPLWAYGLVVVVFGRRGGRRVHARLWNRHPPQEKWGGKAAYYKNIAIPLSIGAQMIARGDVEVEGVVPPETALDPSVFFAELARRGIEIHERVEEYHVLS